MQDYQERVIDEQASLLIKLESLKKFVYSNTFYKLSRIDQHLLVEQLSHMIAYSNTLDLRISLFK